MDYCLAVELFGLKVEAGGAVWSQADRGPNYPVPRGLDDWQVNVGFLRGASRSASGTAAGDNPSDS
jgi:hypothetical protein